MAESMFNACAHRTPPPHAVQGGKMEKVGELAKILQVGEKMVNRW